MKKITLFALAAIVLFGCKTEKLPLKDPKITQAEIAGARLAAATSSDSCNCLLPLSAHACTNATIEKFLGTLPVGTNTVTKWVKWTTCVTNIAISDPNCNVFYAHDSTQLLLCWHSCNSVTAKFVSLPPCIPCYSPGFCMVLTPSTTSSGGNYTEVLSGTISIFDQVQVSIVISTDPDVRIQCSSTDASGVTTVYTCSGGY